MIERVESLTEAEVQRLVDRTYNDFQQELDSLLRDHATEFYSAWLSYPHNSMTSMLVVLNNPLLPYRLHLIPYLVSLRLQ